MNKNTLIAAVVIAIVVVFAGFVVQRGEYPVNLGAVTGPDVYNDMYFHGTITQRTPIISIATTTGGATSTIRAKESGSVYEISASGTTLTLPPVANKGVNYRFVIDGAVDTYNVVIDSAEGDNIEGTLIVAGAVVDCDAEDQLNFVTDGENVGDYVEVYSNGTNWLIADSGILTAGKLTCTDPT